MTPVPIALDPNVHKIQVNGSIGNASLGGPLVSIGQEHEMRCSECSYRKLLWRREHRPLPGSQNFCGRQTQAKRHVALHIYYLEF